MAPSKRNALTQASGITADLVLELDQLQYVLGDRFADYVETATAGAS